MKPFSSSLSLRRAFTLLELLVVISIIAVLAGILLPVANSVIEKARKADARSVMGSIVTAIKSYQSDYSQYPLETTAGGVATDVTFDGRAGGAAGSARGGHNSVLFNVLRAKNTTGSVAYQALNSRKITYFENKDVKSPAAPRGGFIPSVGNVAPSYLAGDLIDPWGNLYSVRIDGNYSDIVMNPYPCSGTAAAPSYTTGDTDSASPNEADILRTPVIAWSFGKDQKPGENGAGALTSSADDVATWQ